MGIENSAREWVSNFYEPKILLLFLKQSTSNSLQIHIKFPENKCNILISALPLLLLSDIPPEVYVLFSLRQTCLCLL